MGKLKRSYSDRLGVAWPVAMTSLRFLYAGKRILDDETPGMLEMERCCASFLLPLPLKAFISPIKIILSLQWGLH